MFQKSLELATLDLNGEIGLRPGSDQRKGEGDGGMPLFWRGWDEDNENGRSPSIPLPSFFAISRLAPKHFFPSSSHR